MEQQFTDIYVGTFLLTDVYDITAEVFFWHFSAWNQKC